MTNEKERECGNCMYLERAEQCKYIGDEVEELYYCGQKSSLANFMQGEVCLNWACTQHEFARKP